jgi:hypothetical protein
MDEKPSLRAQLRDAIIEAAFAAGFFPEQVSAYILALEELGALDTDKPSWIVKSIMFRIENGWRPNHDSFRRINELVGRRVDRWLADPKASPLPDQSFIDALFSDRQTAEEKWEPVCQDEPAPKYNHKPINVPTLPAAPDEN